VNTGRCIAVCAVGQDGANAIMARASGRRFRVVEGMPRVASGSTTLAGYGLGYPLSTC
jgi:hypothetical protein